MLLTGWLAGGLLLPGSAEEPSAKPTVATTAKPTVATTDRPAVATTGADWLAAIRRSADALQWTDEIIRHDWRLQHRPGTESCRILDPRDQVVHEGLREECLAAFEKFVVDGQVQVVDGPTVIVLHGLGEGRRSMRPLVEHLRKQLDATVLSFGYASTAAGIDDHGRALAAVIKGLPAAESISFVGHSMGNLVVRRWMGLADESELGRVERMVMLGPPNQGSELARMAANFSLLAALSNGAARELVFDWNRIANDLAVPPCTFGIVAGGKGDDRGYSSLLTGDDDAVVCVDETHLPGAHDFLLVPVRHSAMMKNAGVQQATTAFLKTGRFPAAVAAPIAPVAH
ncbi:MAG: hypothetical protein WCQ77_06545 [Planctomycetota bacterium]